jgi:hypothetical protein
VEIGYAIYGLTFAAVLLLRLSLTRSCCCVLLLLPADEIERVAKANR